MIVLVSSDVISLGCFQETDRIHQYIIPETFDHWKSCREECHNRGTKV
jgi:hypothetical protein